MEFMTQVYAVGIVLILYFIPMFSLIGIVLYFKKANSKNRVSPLTSDLLRPSGYTLQKQIDDLYTDLMGHFMMAPVAGSMALFMLLVQAQFFDKQLSSTSWVTTAIISLSALVWV